MSVTPSPIIGVTIGSAAFATLTAQPFGYEETNTRAGLSARRWLISGLLTPSEWLDLVDEYDEWRDTRISDEPTETSRVVGTTVNFTGKGPGNQVWESVPCWFTVAPSAEQVGAYLSVSVEIVDADQALEVLLAEQQTAQEEEDAPDLGTITIGSTIVTLTKPIDAYAAGPAVELTATGVNYITGPLVVQKVQDIEGTTDAEGWDDIRDWYETQVVTVPLSGSWFPIAPPSAAAENKVIDGVVTVQYTVSLQLQQVI
jgi:hypothetical protein